MDGILRIQRTYNYGARDIQTGDLRVNWPDGFLVPELTAEECFDIGRKAYLEGGTPPRQVTDWMKVAKSLIDENTEVSLQVDILDHLGYTGTVSEGLEYGQSLPRIMSKYFGEMTN